jgi:hypothetical protein
MVLNTILHHAITRVSCYGHQPLQSPMQSNHETHPSRRIASARHQLPSDPGGRTWSQTISRSGDLWTIQGILKFWLALQHGGAPTITGHQLRASMELHTIESGLPGQLFHQDYKIFGQLATNSWLQHLWEFCDDSNFQLNSTTPQLCLARDLDEFLMKAFASHGYQDSQLTLLIFCRISCHALRLSDISTGDGWRILPRS